MRHDGIDSRPYWRFPDVFHWRLLFCLPSCGFGSPNCCLDALRGKWCFLFVWDDMIPSSTATEEGAQALSGFPLLAGIHGAAFRNMSFLDTPPAFSSYAWLALLFFRAVCLSHRDIIPKYSYDSANEMD